MTEFNEVSKDVFFAAIGGLNVHPSPQGAYDQQKGYRTLWKLPDGRVVGESEGGTVFMPTEYKLPA